eukprot:c7565_g1_i1.p1 GENE.c7565_g1_i1~~c7565_g1_i1.p1  ORF type:complete len:233 (+),score=65.40 c7565_g1_i1:26-700(+)
MSHLSSSTLSKRSHHFSHQHGLGSIQSTVESTPIILTIACTFQSFYALGSLSIAMNMPSVSIFDVVVSLGLFTNAIIGVISLIKESTRGLAFFIFIQSIFFILGLVSMTSKTNENICSLTDPSLVPIVSQTLYYSFFTLFTCFIAYKLRFGLIFLRTRALKTRESSFSFHHVRQGTFKYANPLPDTQNQQQQGKQTTSLVPPPPPPSTPSFNDRSSFHEQYQDQ